MPAKASTLRRGMNLWPPFLCSAIRITHIAEDYRAVDVELRQRFYNRNYVGTHFGGSLFAMCDPFFMLMVMNNLPRDYTVWDKNGSIDFIKPAKGTVRAQFRLSQREIDDIIAALPDDGDKIMPEFTTDIVNADGATVSRYTKRLHIRRKPDTRSRIGG